MAEQKKPKEQAPRKKKPNLLVRFLVFLLVAAVAAGALAFVVFRDELNIDNLRRWIRYRSLLRNDSGQAEAFLYDGGLDDTFAALDGDLLVCSGNAISLYSGSGTRYISQSVNMEHPVVNTNGSQAVVYDAGGIQLFVLGDRTIQWSEEALNAITSARLNASGQLTVVTGASGYRSSVRVYNASFDPVVTVNISSSLAMDAALSDDGKTLAILTVGQEGGTFATTVSFYTLNYNAGEYTPDLTVSLGREVALDIRHASNMLWVVTDQGLISVNHSGELQRVSWENQHLRRYDMGGDGYAAALLGKYRTGGSSELWIADENGKSATLEVDEQVLSISADGRYVAVLTGSSLNIYTADLKLYSSLENKDGARKVLLLENGSAVLVSPTSAGFYIPPD